MQEMHQVASSSNESYHEDCWRQHHHRHPFSFQLDRNYGTCANFLQTTCSRSFGEPNSNGSLGNLRHTASCVTGSWRGVCQPSGGSPGLYEILLIHCPTSFANHPKTTLYAGNRGTACIQGSKMFQSILISFVHLN